MAMEERGAPNGGDRRLYPALGGGLSPVRATSVVMSVGLLVTVLVTATAWTLNRRNEHRLLEVQTRQAASVLAATVVDITNPLSTAVQIATATGGDVEQFTRFMSPYVAPGGLFVSVSLWQSSGSSLRPVASVGGTPSMRPASRPALSFVGRALHSPTFVVTSITAGSQARIGYADANQKNPTFAVYAERAIPANRRAPVESDSAFADLDYATYLGPVMLPADLETTDVPLTDLPLSGDTTHTTIPFGDTTLTLVAAPRSQLGGQLEAELPWILLVAGVLLSLATAVAARQLVKHRRDAEANTGTIAGLYTQLNQLYQQQRSIAETLQRALLPQQHPSIPNLEIASIYVAGTRGVEIGGDWYSFIAVDSRHFAFVVGDVSGKGIPAAAIMARLRFTIRAYLFEGHPPDVVLEMCSRQLDINSDGHFATVLVGIGDLDSGRITLANAGHLNPIIVSGTGAEYVNTDVGVPLGVAPTAYTSSTVVLPSGATFLAFTDGLVERRDESIEVGLQRLAGAAIAPSRELEGYLTGLVAEMAHAGPHDDIAVLAFKWQDAAQDPPDQREGRLDSPSPLAGVVGQRSQHDDDLLV